MPAYGLRRCLVLLAALALAGLALAHHVCRSGELSTHCGQSDFKPVCHPPPPSEHDCTPEAYMIQDRSFFRLNLKTGQVHNISRSVGMNGGGEINSIGYNIHDNYIYGVQNKQLVRIDRFGATKIVRRIPWRTNTGEFDDRGQYWFSSSGGHKGKQHWGRRWGRIDLRDPKSLTYELYDGKSNGYDNVPATADWAYTPESPGYFYGIGVRKGKPKNGQKSTFTPVLIRWSMDNHTWEVVKEAEGLRGNKPVKFGAVMATRDGFIYGVDNKHGRIVRFHVRNDGEPPTYTATGPASNRNDGTRCHLKSDS